MLYTLVIKRRYDVIAQWRNRRVAVICVASKLANQRHLVFNAIVASSVANTLRV